MVISISFGSVGLGVLDLLCNNDKFGELKQDQAIDPESYREIVLQGKFEGSRFCRPMSCD
jgi:hypothetical protein